MVRACWRLCVCLNSFLIHTINYQLLISWWYITFCDANTSAYSLENLLALIKLKNDFFHSIAYKLTHKYIERARFTIHFIAGSLIGCNERCLCFKHNFTWCKRKCAIKVVTDWKIFNQAHPIVWQRHIYPHDFHLLFSVRSLRMRTWHAVINVKIRIHNIQICKQLLHRFFLDFRTSTHRTLISENHALYKCKWAKGKVIEWKKGYGTTVSKKSRRESEANVKLDGILTTSQFDQLITCKLIGHSS